jgi:hypothetical protein
MSNPITPTNFESFNARALKPSQVAQTFVPSRHYEMLSNRANTLLVGPRGSGKTTLLKMLQQPALEAWQHPVAEHYRRRIDFTGVFIATDLTWGAQIDALGDGQLDVRSHRLLADAAFTTHVLRSLVIAMISRTRDGNEAGTVPFRRVRLGDQAEAALARGLAQSWYLKPSIPSLLSVKQSLSDRLKTISEIGRREATLTEDGRFDRLRGFEFFHLDFLQACAVATEQFDDMVGEADNRWALMFDELEIAPQWIRDNLVKMLRSIEPRFLFKLALNPYSEEVLPLEAALSPAPDHDYEQIQLWYAERFEGYDFCNDLWRSMLEAKGLPNQKPETALGISLFETPSDEWARKGTAYGAGSRLGQLFTKMAATDKSFADYLMIRGINPEALHLLTPEQRAADIRKVAPILPIREFYRAPDNPSGSRSRVLRSRKRAALYTGADAIFAVSEGNPRLFIAIVGRMLDRWPDPHGRLPSRIQADEIERGAERFSAMLRTIPASRDSSDSLLETLDTIGKFFHSQIVSQDFVAEPPGTFVVDLGVPDALVASLGQALNAGAIVFVPEDRSQVLLRELRGQRFRLSYLLAPNYGTALRLGRKINLSTIMRDGDQRRQYAGQLTLEDDSNV